MRRAALALALLLAACAPRQGDPLAPPPDAVTAPAQAAAAQPAVRDAPHIYMALQRDAGGPTSVILAIDASRDNTPSDDPAVRITPDNGACNPQQLRWYEFPAARARRPIYGPEEAGRGVTARELPDYLAMAVTSEMMAAGLIEEPDESKPQNVCTRKLMQRMIIDRSSGQG